MVVSAGFDKLAWWKRVTNMNNLIGLKHAKLHLFNHHVSSSCVFVFSLLNNSSKENQAIALEDYIETSIMLQYNSV